jgi:hypothetical protein
MVNDDESGPLFNPVTMEEIKVVLFHLKKIRAQGLMAGRLNFSPSSLI